MQLPAQLDGLEHAALPDRPLHLAIGMFDGVHLGHRAVVGAAVQAARAGGGISGVLTFWPHPSALFRPENPTKLMQEPAIKGRMLLALGVDVVISQPFTPELAALPAEEFLAWLKRQLPRLAGVYIGENFRFGQGRRGDIGVLTASGPGCGVTVQSAPRVQRAGEPVSSTRIRAQLQAGDIAAANALLGYVYFATGIVTGGKRLGRTIGFPTLNLEWHPELSPRLGVYAVRVSGAEGAEALPGVANYGLRPTVEKATAPRLETHVLGPCPFTEGDRIKVEWLHFLRPEMKFPDLEALRAQIEKDRSAAAAILA
jgi:riboflavin kinase / FMN adenylyltransferase